MSRPEPPHHKPTRDCDMCGMGIRFITYKGKEMPVDPKPRLVLSWVDECPQTASGMVYGYRLHRETCKVWLAAKWERPSVTHEEIVQDLAHYRKIAGITPALF